MRFEPLHPWLARNDGRSTLAWVVRLGLIAILLVAMFLPYPYEPSGKLRILPARQVGVRARIQGRIQEVLVNEGDRVEAGQLLVRLDARRTVQDLEMARVELERAKAQRTLLLAGGKPEEVARANENLERATAELYWARREADRLGKLYEENAISLSLYERGLEKRDVSKEAYDTAVENLRVVATGVKQETLEFQQTEIMRLETRVRQYEDDLALAEIRSPAAGVVVTPRIGEHAGMEVFLGDMVASIEDSRELMAEVELPERTAAEIEIGARAKLKVWTYPNRTFIGEVAQIAPVVTDKGRKGTVEYLNTSREDALSRAATSEDERVLRVLVRLPNPDGLLKADMTGYGKIFSSWKPFGVVMTHSLVRFFCVEVWSWIP